MRGPGRCPRTPALRRLELEDGVADLEVVPRDADGRVLGVEELARNEALLEEYYGRHSAAEIVGSTEDNTYMSYPEGARFEWKSNVLAHFEGMIDAIRRPDGYGVWQIPVISGRLPARG